MLSVKDVIEAYDRAIEDDDRVRASRLLESLEDEVYRNEADWQTICDFFKARRFNARLEIVTKALIKAACPTSPQPYLVLSSLLIKSGRVAEARPLVKAYIQNSENSILGRELIELLFEIEDYEGALRATQDCLRKEPNEFQWLILEARAYWKLKNRPLARAKLHDLADLKGNHIGHVAWFVSAALEFQEPALAKRAAHLLILRLEQGSASLSRSVAGLLKSSGHDDKIQKFIACAELHKYPDLAKIEEIFELSVRYGVYRTAAEFGAEILRRDQKSFLRREIEQILHRPQFLMS